MAAAAAAVTVVGQGRVSFGLDDGDGGDPTAVVALSASAVLALVPRSDARSACGSESRRLLLYDLPADGGAPRCRCSFQLLRPVATAASAAAAAPTSAAGAAAGAAAPAVIEPGPAALAIHH